MNEEQLFFNYLKMNFRSDLFLVFLPDEPLNFMYHEFVRSLIDFTYRKAVVAECLRRS